MANTKFKYFILTGDPGVGKTTLTKKIASCLRETGISTSGFYTEEVRRNRVREGFDVVTLDGDRGRLAREESLLNSPVKHRVGKYGVTIQEFENLALPSLEKVNTCSPHLLVIDEIGKMEFYSQLFKTKIKDIFSDTSNSVVLASIPMRKSDAVIEAIRNHKNAKVFVVTRENRNTIDKAIMEEMKRTLNVI
ncbi:cancer-related nucleoside-triphosphatase isoform X1 [Plodia interpunctella]|uniref:cancer-related nucleoside-triphosphatase isoform X1 n=1 Tax=Plodia interpunctella TaxID=58824 RepID=UPI002368CAAF|nr:cancer-related nucleoside-triphosphatase isoform X1 [Plodia interpunctella]